MCPTSPRGGHPSAFASPWSSWPSLCFFFKAPWSFLMGSTFKEMRLGGGEGLQGVVRAFGRVGALGGVGA